MVSMHMHVNLINSVFIMIALIVITTASIYILNITNNVKIYILIFSLSLSIALYTAETIFSKPIRNIIIDRYFKLFIGFLYIFIVILIFQAGYSKYETIKEEEKTIIARYNDKTWNVLLNNGDSFILTDTNNSNIVKIVKNENIEYFKNISK